MQRYRHDLGHGRAYAHAHAHVRGVGFWHHYDTIMEHTIAHTNRTRPRYRSANPRCAPAPTTQGAACAPRRATALQYPIKNKTGRYVPPYGRTPLVYCVAASVLATLAPLPPRNLEAVPLHPLLTPLPTRWLRCAPAPTTQGAACAPTLTLTGAFPRYPLSGGFAPCVPHKKAMRIDGARACVLRPTVVRVFALAPLAASCSIGCRCLFSHNGSLLLSLCSAERFIMINSVGASSSFGFLSWLHVCFVPLFCGGAPRTPHPVPLLRAACRLAPLLAVARLRASSLRFSPAAALLSGFGVFRSLTLATLSIPCNTPKT